MDNKKIAGPSMKVLISAFIGGTFLIMIIVGILFYALDMYILEISFDLKSRFGEMFFVSLAAMVLIYFYVFQSLLVGKKPKNLNELGRMRWRTENELKENFKIAEVDLKEQIETAGTPVHMFVEKGKQFLIYCDEALHDLWVGTTRSGKSRKIIRQLVMLAVKAKESVVFNDPKKEFFFDFDKLLKKVGYDTYCLDFRNLKYSDHYNPMDNLNYMVENDRLDDADSIAQDMVTSLVVDNGSGERIWIDGQKALIKALLLAVSQANINNNKKNFYSVFQSFAVQGTTIKVDGNDKMILSAFMESLPESNLARTSFAPISNSPDKTRGSFMTSAMATLQIFSSQALMKVLGKSDFHFDEFVDGEKALFIVNPDEKSTYDAVAAMIFDQAYQRLVFFANQQDGSKLKKKVHMIFDEYGNMPVINSMASKITVALSRGIVYHLFVQDYSQLDSKYGQNDARTIRSNCNFTGFISTSDMGTAKEIAERIGNETAMFDNTSTNLDSNANVSGAGLSYNRQEVPLVNANQLMAADVRDGKGIIIYKTYFGSSQVYLPDASQYDWYSMMTENVTRNTEQVEQTDNSLAYAIPRYVEINSTVLKNLRGVKTPPIGRGNSSLGSNKVESKNMYWYWSMREDLQSSVLERIYEFCKREDLIDRNDTLIDGARKEIIAYLNSEEFYNWMEMTDYSDISQLEEEEERNKEVEKRLNAEMEQADENIQLRLSTQQRNAFKQNTLGQGD